MTAQKEWFKYWFDTKYYHILYQDRNNDEAEYFMRNLVSYLNLNKNAKLLDLPCGKGRHAIFLNTMSYTVVGADLSKNSILHAKKHENNTLKFKVHDMRKPLQTKFDAILNLFTSFGYFDKETNINVLRNLKKGLKENGVLVIDFMNVNYVKQHLVEREIVTKSGIDFKITRNVVDHFIIKKIQFTADAEEHCYTEQVRDLPLELFKTYIKASGLHIKQVFGDYALNKFNEDTSKRLILILE